MVAISTLSWEEVASPNFGARSAYRDVVAQIAVKAHEKLPECNGRVDAAVKLVLACWWGERRPQQVAGIWGR